jgi:hypothetical protein
MMMTDVTTIARNYIDLWNERTPRRRREILVTNWTSDARYVDPLMCEPNGFGDHLRFSWGLGPDGADSPIKGTDFALLKDGRIRSITGFLDQVPAGV